MEDVLFSTGLNDAETSNTLDEYLLYRNAAPKHKIKMIMYRYLRDTTFKMKYLIGAIDESGSAVFSIVLNFKMVLTSG
jgi:hypothetical protein